MNAAVGLADLARLFVRLAPANREARDELAAALGLERRAPEPAPRPPTGAVPTVVPASSSAPTTPMRFWRLEAETVSPGAPAIDDTQPAPLSARDVAKVTATRRSAALAPPIEPWNALWPKLRAALGATARGSSIDLRAVVRRWARLEPLERLPRLHRPAWPRSVHLWSDPSRRLAPLAGAQRAVGEALVRAGVDVDRPDARAPLLVVSDLGCYGYPDDCRDYLRAGRRLRAADRHLAALVPAPRRFWDAATARVWNAIPWGRSRAAPDRAAHGLDQLLTLLSPTSHAEPGLVRSLRELIDPLDADLSTEVLLAFSPEVARADALGVVLRPEAYAARRVAFAALDAPLRAAVAERIRAHHAAHPEQLLAETLVWHEYGADREGVALGDLEEARAFLGRIAPTVADSHADPQLARSLRLYAANALQALPDRSYAQPWLAALWMETRRHAGDAMPASIDPDTIPPPPTAPPRRFALHQSGEVLIVSAAAGPAWPSQDERGSPIGLVTATAPEVWLQEAPDGSRARHRLADGAELPLPESNYLQLSTDGGSVTLRAWARPTWAVAAGRDAFGLWATFAVGGIEQRMRWIPPGRFTMGSPLTEAGRFQNETQREVAITDGFWLGETSVTQALWTAVMGDNPSRFLSDDRPVEQVSWDDCRTFCQKLAVIAPELGPRFPIEEEWEYACRAGTTTATWVGDLTLVGANHAPELDAIAWYGGNSGRGFELKNGVDASGWPDRQYPDDRKAGTHPVGRRAPNPHGLYDMLGNVFVWCMDRYRAGSGDSTGASAPASALSDEFPRRAIRGGSWSSLVGRVRAAYRGARPADERGDYLGFRLAGGPSAHQLGSQAAGEQRSGELAAAGRGVSVAKVKDEPIRVRKLPPPRRPTRKRTR